MTETELMIQQVQAGYDEMCSELPPRDIEIILWGACQTLEEWALGLSKALGVSIPRKRLKRIMNYYQGKGMSLPNALECAMNGIKRTEERKKRRWEEE